MTQNTSTAVMASRTKASRKSLNDFPTHPWAVRAFVEHVLLGALGLDVADLTAWEPAANRRFMSRALSEYFGCTWETDIHDYGVNLSYFDFLSLGVGEMIAQPPHFADAVNWVVTNPPFKKFGQWVETAMNVATDGIALFGRLQMLETIGRCEGIWQRYQGQALCAVYADRVPLVEGRLDPDADTATAYAWLVIDKTQTFDNPFPGEVYVPTIIIPPCCEEFVRDGDYEVRAAA